MAKTDETQLHKLDDNSARDYYQGMSGGAIGGCIIGALVLLAIIVFLIVWFVCLRNRWRQQKHTTMPPSTPPPALAQSSAPVLLAAGPSTLLSAKDTPAPTRPTPNPLYPASLGFSDADPTRQGYYPTAYGNFGTTGQYGFQGGPPNYYPANVNPADPHGTSLVVQAPSMAGTGGAVHAFGFPWSNTTSYDPFAKSNQVENMARQQNESNGKYGDFAAVANLGYRFDECPVGGNNEELQSRWQPKPTDNFSRTQTGAAVAGDKRSTSTIREKVHSRVRAAAHFSQSQLLNLRRWPSHKSSNGTSVEEQADTERAPKRRPSKVRRTSAQKGKMRKTGSASDADEGYYNSNLTNEGLDERSSLDNDSFLWSLDNVTFEDSMPEENRTAKRDASQRRVRCSRHTGKPSAALGSANVGGPPVTSRFQFPPPGPPVAGWAVSFAAGNASGRGNDKEAQQPQQQPQQSEALAYSSSSATTSTLPCPPDEMSTLTAASQSQLDSGFHEHCVPGQLASPENTPAAEAQSPPT